MAITPTVHINTVRPFTVSPQMNTDLKQITSLPVAASLREPRPKSLKGIAHRATATVIGGQKVSVFPHELFNLAYNTIEFVDEI